MNSYGQIIRDLRLAAGLTQRELAAKLGCTDGFLAFAELERRFPSTEFFQKLIATLNPSEAERQRLLDAIVAGRQLRAEQKEQARYTALSGAIGGGIKAREEASDAPPVETPAEKGNEEFERALQNLRIAFANSEMRPALLGTLEAFAQSAQAKPNDR